MSKLFTLELKQEVVIKINGRSGTVEARVDYASGGPDQFCIRYLDKDGDICDGWFDASMLKLVDADKNSLDSKVGVNPQKLSYDFRTTGKVRSFYPDLAGAAQRTQYQFVCTAEDGTTTYYWMDSEELGGHRAGRRLETK